MQGRGWGSQGGAGVGKAPCPGAGGGTQERRGPVTQMQKSKEGCDLPSEVPEVRPSRRCTAVKWGESSLPPTTHLTYQEPVDKELGSVSHSDYPEKRSSVQPWRRP